MAKAAALQKPLTNTQLLVKIAATCFLGTSVAAAMLARISVLVRGFLGAVALATILILLAR